MNNSNGTIVKDNNGDLYFFSNDGKVTKIQLGPVATTTAATSSCYQQQQSQQPTSTNNLATISSQQEEENEKEKEIKLWTEVETMSMLELYKDNKDSYKIKKKLWQKLSEKLMEEKIKATPEQCENKFKNLSNTFRNKIDRENKSGSGKERKWEFMDIMLDIHEQKANGFPEKVTDVGSLPGNVNEQVVPDQRETPEPSKPKRKRTSQESMIEFFREMHEERKKEAKERHEQNLNSFNRLLDILERKL